MTALVGAVLVLPDGPRTAPLRFANGRILSVGVPPRRGEAVIDVAGLVIYPGLINAHDHLELNHYPRSKFQPVYRTAHQWGEDFLPRLDQPPFAALRQMPLEEQCRVGGIKNIACGVTTVAQHNPLHKPLRHRDFPVHVLRRYGWAHSLHFTGEAGVQASHRLTPRHFPWFIHLAEGTDEIAAGELARLEALGCLGANTVLIHGVGLDAAARARVIAAGAGLVWCPSSNRYLLDQTAHVAEFAVSGRLAIGSDSRLTADGDLLDELRAARAEGQLTDAQLFRAVTSDAARLLRLSDCGALRPGLRADFFIARADPADPISGLFTLRPPDILAVYVGGVQRWREQPAQIS